MLLFSVSVPRYHLQDSSLVRVDVFPCGNSELTGVTDLDGRWKSAVNAINPMGTQGRLASAFATILYEMSHSELPHLTPTTFRVSLLFYRVYNSDLVGKKSICAHAPQFSGADQHDSQEFLTFLLDGLHEDLNRVLHKPSNGSTPEREAELERLPQSIASTQEWEIYRMRNDSLIVDFFQGQFRNRLQCLTCYKVGSERSGRS